MVGVEAVNTAGRESKLRRKIASLIDGRVYVRGQLPLGQFASVKVVGHTDYDLIAQPA